MGSAVVLMRVSFGSPIPDAVGLLIPATAGLFQLNIEPGVPLVGLYENRLLLQIAGGVKALLNVGIGLTVTVVPDVAVQPLASVTVTV